MSDQLPPVPEPPRERRPSTLGGLIYLLVLAATLAGLALVAIGPWRRGVGVIGVALLVAAGGRIVVGEGNAGMLRVKGRWFDAAGLVVVGALLVVLAAVIPDQPS